jgi:thymidylate synthase ThyX
MSARVGAGMASSFEEYTPEQERLLGGVVTNTKGPVFALYGLPEVVKGALFSRYSRSTLGLRTLLLREFLADQEGAGTVGSGAAVSCQLEAIKKAQKFYDRILDGYGDDSIGELGGAHLAIENISMLAAKALEDCRIGGSPLEKSTRYIYFDQKINGEYLFHREAVLMTSAWKSLYVNTCTMLFETYSRLIQPMTMFMGNRFPKDPEISTNAYTAALRAKVLDCIRGLLPASALTNMGLFGNGRFYEGLLHKLQVQRLGELREIGRAAYDELTKIIPSFVRRADPHHKTHQEFAQYAEAVRSDLEALGAAVPSEQKGGTDSSVRLIASDPDAVVKVAAGLLYQEVDIGFSDLLEYCRALSPEEIGRILDAGADHRMHRRHKSPRALENASFTFEITADFGSYRDLQRHRMMTQERQRLTCSHGYYIPKEIIESGLEGEYRAAMDASKAAYDTIASELPEEAQYVVPMAYNIRWYVTANVRALQWIAELRSISAGHPAYRAVAQQISRCVIEAFPAFERFFQFVDYESYDVGRLEQEVRSEQKRQALVSD